MEKICQSCKKIFECKVDDIENCVIKLVAAGATVLHDTSNVGGGIKVATVIDPWGNAVGLIEGA